MLQVFAQLDEFIAGRAVSKSGKDLAIGRPKSLFRVDEALRLRKLGTSWRKIAKQLGVPEATVRVRCAEKCPPLQVEEPREQRTSTA